MAVRVDFYVVSDGGPEARERVACRLAEKAWRKQHRVFVHTASRAAATKLDELLWTFRQDSFVPHGLDSPAADPGLPILLGGGTSPTGECEVLINVANQVPEFFERFVRIADVVGLGEEQRKVGRDRYRLYREHGCEIRSHDV